MKRKPILLDFILLIIGVLLLITIAAFLTGFLPYPVGIVVLSILFVARLISLRRKQG